MRDSSLTGYTPKPITGLTPDDVILVDEPVVACDNGGGALGHPRVFLRIEQKQITCPYCSRTYRLKEGVSGGGQH